MLQKYSVASTHALASMLNRKGISLDVEPNSALGDLMSHCDLVGDRAFVDSNDECVVTDELSPADQVFEACAVEDLSGVQNHGAEMERLMRLAGQATNLAFDFARNVVNPQTKDVVQATQDYVDQQTKRRMEPITIESVFLNPALSSASLAEMVAPFADALVVNVPPARLTATWPEGGVSEALATGDADLDEAVAKMYGDGSQAKALWESFFADSAGNYRPSNMQEAMPDAESTLVVFLGANALLENDIVPEGLTMNLAAYRAYLAQLREQTGARLAYFAKQHAARVAGRQLVISAPMKNPRGGIPTGTVKVAGEVYNDWLAKGGSPEALYQAVHEGRPLQYGVLLDEAEGLHRRWLTTMGLLETQRKFERQTAIISGMRQALYQLYLNLPDNLKPFVPYSSDSEFLSAVGDRLSHFHVKDLDDLYMVARKAICRVFYPQTAAERILNALDNVMQDNPGYTPAEAALLVRIDYVTDWVGDAILVKTVPGNQTGAQAA